MQAIDASCPLEDRTPESRITIWHQAASRRSELAERAAHSRLSMSLDVYSHITPADEVPAGRFQSLLPAERR